MELSTLSVQQRVCMELLRLARSGDAAGASARIEPVPTHSELAHRISSYREQITRGGSSALAKAGVLRAMARRWWCATSPRSSASRGSPVPG